MSPNGNGSGGGNRPSAPHTGSGSGSRSESGEITGRFIATYEVRDTKGCYAPQDATPVGRFELVDNAFEFANGKDTRIVWNLRTDRVIER